MTQLSSSRKSVNNAPTETEKFKIKFNFLNSQNDDFEIDQTVSAKANLTNSPNEESPYLLLWKNFIQRIILNNKRIKLKKEYDNLQKKIEQYYQDNPNIMRNQSSPTPESNARYPFHQNDAVRPPRKRKQLQNNNQANESPTRAPIIKINTISPNRRSSSVQNRKSKQQEVSCRIVKVDRSDYQQKLRIKKLWKMLSQHLRRSKQRIILFHSARKIQLRKYWQSLILAANREKRIYDLKVQIFRVAVLIINQIFTNNRIQPIPSSYVSKPLLFQLRSSSITTVLTSLLRLYYNRRSNKERGGSFSVSMPFTSISIERDTIISNSKMFDIIHKAFLNSPISIRENDVDDQTVEELIPVVDFNNETKFVSGNPDDILANLLRLTRRDIRLVVNDRIVSDLLQGFFSEVNYPITSNVPDEAAIRSITSNLTIEDSLPFVSKPNIDSIFDITQKDMKVYVNQRFIDNEISKIISNIHLPIELNTVNDLTAREIVEEDVFDDVIESEFAFPYVNNDFEYKDNKSSLLKILNYTSVDIRMYFSGRFVDDMIDDLYDQISIEIPVVSNRPTDKTCREIIDIDEYHDFPFGDYIENKREVHSWVDPVENYEAKDFKLYVNNRIISKLIGRLYSQIKNSIPIVPNTVDNDVINQILSLPIEDSLTTLPLGKNKSIENYKARDLRFYVNNRVIDDILNNVYTSIPFPIVPNKITRKQVNEILEDDFNDVYGIYSAADEWIEPLMNVDPNNRTIVLDERVVSRALNGLKNKILSKLPIVPNDVDDDTLLEILDCSDDNCDKFEKSCILTIDPLVDVSSLFNIEATDIRKYVNKRNIDDIISNIFDETEIPLTRNDIDEGVINEITNDGIEDVFGQLPLDFSTPIENFKPKDIQLYVNDRIVDGYMGRMFDSLRLPLTVNEVSDRDIQEILEDEDYGDGVPPISERSIEESLLPLYFNFDPCERKINFNDFPISAGQFAREALIHLPLCPNDVTDSEIDSILTYLDDKTTFKKSDKNTNDDNDNNVLSLSSALPLGNADPLKRYIAPVEVFESIDDVVERIMNRLLANEIFPSIPIEKQAFVDNQTANAILSQLSKKQPNSVLIDEKDIFNLLITKPKSVIDIEPLKDFDIPEPPLPEVAPDDILNGILWHEVLTMLPIVPKRKRLIDFHDVVDEIVIDNYVDRVDGKSSNESDAKSVKSSRSDKSNRSNKSNKSNKSAAADLICRLLTDSDNSYEIEENLPYLMTSPSNPPSPTTSSPYEKSKQKNLHQEEEQQYIKSYLDTSSESMSCIADENNNHNSSIKKKKELEVNQNKKIVVNVEDSEYNGENISFSFEEPADAKIKIEKIIIEEEEEECEVVEDLIRDDFEEEKIEKIVTKVILSDDDNDDFEEEKIEKFEKIETKVDLSDIDDFEEEVIENVVSNVVQSSVENKKVENTVIVKKTSNVENILIIEEEEEDVGNSIEIDLDFDVDVVGGDENKIKFDSITINEEEDHLTDLLSDDFSD